MRLSKEYNIIQGGRSMNKAIEKLNSGDLIVIDLFGKEEEVEVFSTGDNQFDENGEYKEEGFALTGE